MLSAEFRSKSSLFFSCFAVLKWSFVVWRSPRTRLVPHPTAITMPNPLLKQFASPKLLYLQFEVSG